MLTVAPQLLGKAVVRAYSNGAKERFVITEVEAYRGIEDLACHAAKGRTARTEAMYSEGGVIYVFLIYGVYWMLNFVTSTADNPQAVLIRGVVGCNGPGSVGKLLDIDRSFYAENLETSKRIWVEDLGKTPTFTTSPRIGVAYSGEYWSKIPWRFVADNL